jgi:hypothetical protein
VDDFAAGGDVGGNGILEQNTKKYGYRDVDWGMLKRKKKGRDKTG